MNISEIMKDAGVTVGGFYRHFSSKEVLVSEAISLVFSETLEWNAIAETQLERAVHQYLSSAQYDDLASCAVFSSVAADISRSSAATREVFNHHLQATLTAIAQGLNDGEVKALEQKAVAILTTLVGASLLARATSDRLLSHKVLTGAKSEVYSNYLSATAAGRRL